jgi:uncharacterized protein YdhG (YjbR/CyaY superfamily)
MAGLSKDEQAAVKQRAAEVKKEATRTRGKDRRAAGLADVLAVIAAMPEDDRALAQRVHDVIVRTAPQLDPRTWYGMPAYALDGTVVCFLQVGSKFGTRYATLGFNDAAQLDDGPMWPTAFAIVRMTRATESRIRDLLRTALGTALG